MLNLFKSYFAAVFQNFKYINRMNFQKKSYSVALDLESKILKMLAKELKILVFLLFYLLDR
jgi:hypothetical protein